MWWLNGVAEKPNNAIRQIDDHDTIDDAMKRLIVLMLVLIGLLDCLAAQASATEDADVVVIVDTSTSMKEPGMDPDRASLLVSKLLADIVPGNLAVVRLLGIGPDSGLLPSRPTGEFGPCPETPQEKCGKVERATDWDADARKNKFGVLTRPHRADLGYKKSLESHLDQRIGNSMFTLAFQSALGIFDGHPGSSPRMVVWLSDGSSEHEEQLKKAIALVKAQGATVEAVVFGAGDTRLPREADVETVKVSNPTEMMAAFANVFRRIVQAPYRIDNRYADTPSFEIKHNVQEAWIVVYGDKSLAEVDVKGPGLVLKADYAEDVWPTAGAYKVAYLQNPPSGPWSLNVHGGGADVAYAVIQRSDLEPILLAPEKALTGSRTILVAGIASGPGGEPFSDPEILKDAVLSAKVQGSEIALHDDGLDADAKAGDGRYSGYATFSVAGRIPVRLHLQSTIVSRDGEAFIAVGGVFRYLGGPLDIDFGTLGVAAESCRPLELRAEQQGDVAVELQSLRRLPAGHFLEARMRTGVLHPDGISLAMTVGEPVQLCLKTAPRVSSSEADGEPWLAFKAAGSEQAGQQATINLRWRVSGLSFWAMWGWLVCAILAALAVLIVLLGFILPQRFRGALAVVFVPDREDLDEQSPQPVRQWQGVGIGFYRDARAYLHPDYRLSGKARGALAELRADRGGNRVLPGNGANLFRETADGDWESVPPQGCRCRPGDVFRVGGSGPYFRIATRG